MKSKATTVKDYLASLPEDRRKGIEAVRKVIRANLDKQYEEGMLYGMIGFLTALIAGYVASRALPVTTERVSG